MQKNINSEEINLIPIYISVSTLVAFHHAERRQDNLTEWIKRYDTEDEQFTEFEKKIKHSQVDCEVIKNNKKLDNAVSALIRYIEVSEK